MNDFEQAMQRSLEERIAELPTDPAKLVDMLAQQHMLELLAWDNCPEWVALRRILSPSSAARSPTPWAAPVRYDSARGYIIDANGAYVCPVRSVRSDEFNEEIAKALNAYTSPPSSIEAIPAGWKLVPVEMTPAMEKAYKNAMRNYIANVKASGGAGRWKEDSRGYVIPEREKAFARWDAMLASAPTPPTSPSSATTGGAEDKDTRILELHSALHHSLQNTDEAIEHFERFAGEVLPWCEESIGHYASCPCPGSDRAVAIWTERGRLVKRLLEADAEAAPPSADSEGDRRG